MSQSIPPAKWIPVFRKFLAHLRIRSKDDPAGLTGAGVAIDLWGSQERFLAAIEDGLSHDRHKFYFLKSRQLGITTVSLALDLFYLAMFPGTKGALIVDEDRNREAFRNELKMYIESFPEGFFGETFAIRKGGDNRYGMKFTNNSQLDFLVAGLREKESFGDGGGYSLCHFCAAPGTPVIVEDGRVKAIEDVEIGTKVLTHTGALAVVIDAFGQPNNKGPMIRIHPWLGDPITCSLDHTIPTQRGTIEAQEVGKDDWLVMPVREIQDAVRAVLVPPARMLDYARAAGTRPRRVDPVGADQMLPLNEETGFAVGYYLAEGSIERAQNGRPSGLVFTRHRDEADYSRRAIKALAPFLTESRLEKDRAGTLTSQDSVYGSAIAQWIDDVFGSKDEKRIPDAVFTWGESFCRGLLTGLLCGDGSKSVTKAQNYKTNTVVMPTTRSSLAMQARDIAASLGVGWAACRHDAGGMKYGRLCKPSWRLTWCGNAAATLRKMMGLAAVPQHTKNQAQKYKIENGLVYIKIRFLTRGVEVPYMWDLSVDHDDHTFRTPSMSIGNTEVGRYGCEGALRSFEQALSERNPNRLYIYESRAAGPNHWQNMWRQAAKDVYTIRRCFIGWWSHPGQKIARGDPRWAAYGTLPPDADERDLIAAVKEMYEHTVTREQLAWYRWRADDEGVDIDVLRAQQPWTEEEAFVTAGSTFFHARLLARDYERIEDPDGGAAFRAFKYHMGESFFETSIEETYAPPAGLTPDRQIAWQEEQWQLKVWEEPVKGAKYVIGMDPAFGRNDNKNNHAVSVWRCYADKIVQVAEYASCEDVTLHAAWVLAHLAGNYEDCMINLEITGPGAVVMQELDILRGQLRREANQAALRERRIEDFLTAARWYIYSRPDSAAKPGSIYNFKTGFESKRRALNHLKNAHYDNSLLINSKPLVDEMLGVRMHDGEIGALGRNNDDRVMAAALAVMAYKEWRQRELVAQNYLYEEVTRQESEGYNPSRDPVGMLVRNYLKQVERQEEEAEYDMTPRTWMEQRGFS
jgi:hypothetical protein